MKALPPGWASASLADLIADDGILSDGDWVESKDQDPAGVVRLIQLADVGDGEFLDKSNRFISEQKFDQLRCTEILKGDVIVARMPHPLGRACLVPTLSQRCITVVDVAIVRPGSSVRPAWLMHFLNAPAVRLSIELQGSGSTRRRISRKKLAKLELPIPPVAEQDRIAEKVGDLIERAKACSERLDTVRLVLERLRQSILEAATSGDLTRGWREGRNAEPSWEEALLGSLLVDLRYGTAKKCAYEPHKTPVLRIPNIVNGSISHDDIKYADFNEKELAKLSLAAGDILMVRSNGSLRLVGATALISDQEAGHLYAGYLIRLRCDLAQIRPAYLSLYLASPRSRGWIESTARSTTGVNNINAQEIRAIPAVVPPLDEQVEIVRRVGELFEIARRIESRVKAAQELLEMAAPSCLAKATRGELVLQDSSDEPAFDLLARIRSRSSRSRWHA